jgi:hypothetical protein
MYKRLIINSGQPAEQETSDNAPDAAGIVIASLPPAVTLCNSKDVKKC